MIKKEKEPVLGKRFGPPPLRGPMPQIPPVDKNIKKL
jgi:hypothetical protein